MSKEFTIFKGSEYTIEWYYDVKGKSSAKKYFDSLDRERKLQSFELFKTMSMIEVKFLILLNLDMKEMEFSLSNPNMIDFFVFSFLAKR